MSGVSTFSLNKFDRLDKEATADGNQRGDTALV